jgi:hypothetical protein
MKKHEQTTNKKMLLCLVVLVLSSWAHAQVLSIPGPAADEDVEVSFPFAPGSPDAADSLVGPSPIVQVRSLDLFVQMLAQAMEKKATAEKIQGPIRVEATVGRGINERGLEEGFMTRLRARLRKGRVLYPVARSRIRCRIAFSAEKSRIWAVGVFEGNPLAGPNTFAVSVTLDRSLEVVFGKGLRHGQTRWTWGRMGPIAGGALDIVTEDLDGDLIDEIIVLSVDGVRVYRFLPGDFRPEKKGGPYFLPEKRRWPRTVTGWIASFGKGRFWVATTAGHAFMLDLRTGRYKRPPRSGVPLRQSQNGANRDGSSILLLSGQYGNPALKKPIANASGKRILIPPLPSSVRDLVHVSADPDIWIWVSDEGDLGGRYGRSNIKQLADVGLVGDRILSIDFDQDGALELLVSSAVYREEADEVIVYRLGGKPVTATEIFRTSMGGGSVAAMALGALDLDENPDLVVVEKTGKPQDILWRLEYSP